MKLTAGFFSSSGMFDESFPVEFLKLFIKSIWTRFYYIKIIFHLILLRNFFMKSEKIPRIIPICDHSIKKLSFLKMKSKIFSHLQNGLSNLFQSCFLIQSSVSWSESLSRWANNKKWKPLKMITFCYRNQHYLVKVINLPRKLFSRSHSL